MSLSPPNLQALKKISGRPESEAFGKASVGNKEERVATYNETHAKLTSSSNEFHFDCPLPDTRLKKLDAVAFSCVLQDVVSHLKILGCMGNLPQAKCNFEYKTLKQQYGGEGQQSCPLDTEELEPNEVGCEIQPFLKFQRDRYFLEQTLERVEEEIYWKLSITNFLQGLSEHHLAETERDQLLADRAASLETIKVLSDMLQHEKHRLTAELHEKSKELGAIKDQYEDMAYEKDIKTNYVDQWEDARLYQNNKLLQDKEDDSSNAIRAHKINIQKEMRVNSEIEAFENYLQTTYIQEIENWTNKYSKDLDQKEMEKQVLAEKREEQVKRLSDLAQLYDSHKKEMEDYLVLREQRRIEAAELERLNKAATKIQAWWRGVMYRRGLGPYRKKKGKKEAKGKGKK